MKPRKEYKAKIRQNVWGNWNGYIGTRRVIEFGTNKYCAEEWLYEATNGALADNSNKR